MEALKIKLKKKEVGKLRKVSRKGSAKARTIARCRILLLSNDGKKPGLIAETLEVTLKTIQNVKERFLNGGIQEAIYDKPRSGAPTKFAGKHRAKLTALACSQAPKGHAKWSLTLLADKAVELGIVDEISHTHYGRILKKTKSNRTSKGNGVSKK